MAAPTPALSASTPVLFSVLNSNTERLSLSQSWSAGIYGFIAIAMMAETFLLASMIAWSVPEGWLVAMPRYKEVKFCVAYWLYPCLLLFFLVTGGAGMAGWMVTGGLYLILIVLFGSIAQYRTLKNRKRDAETGLEMEEEEQLAHTVTAKERKEALTSEQWKERIHEFFNYHSKGKKKRMDPSQVDALILKSAGREDELLESITKKFGPETDKEKWDRLIVDGIEANRKKAKGSMWNDEELEEILKTWNRSPKPMGKSQSTFALVAFGVFILAIASVLMLVYIWEIDPYRVVKRSDPALPGSQLDKIEEITPQLTAKAISLMYSWPHFATDLRLEIYVSILTNLCGDRFKEALTSPAAKEVIKTEWIDVYDINMTDFNPSDYLDYNSVNEWFKRELAPGARPLQGGNDTVVSPADARTLVFSSVRDSKVWVKGADFSFSELLDNQMMDGDRHYWDDGVMVISRLAPSDYHRFHSPVAGTIYQIRTIPGTLWSVGADAAQSENYVFYNQRQIVIIDAGPPLEKVAYVAIGATCVGSVILSHADGTPLRVGDTLARGQEMGFMQFGGSTVITLYKKGSFLPDCDLLQASQGLEGPVEMYMRVKESLGKQNIEYASSAECV